MLLLGGALVLAQLAKAASPSSSSNSPASQDFSEAASKSSSVIIFKLSSVVLSQSSVSSSSSSSFVSFTNRPASQSPPLASSTLPSFILPSSSTLRSLATAPSNASSRRSSNGPNSVSSTSRAISSKSASTTSNIHFSCDGTCRYSFTAAIVTHPSMSRLSTQVITTTAYEVPITYRLPNGQLLTTTSTYANYQRNATDGQQTFEAPEFVQPTFTYKSYTLTAPTTYFVIPTGGIYGYYFADPVDESCDKSDTDFNLELAPVPFVSTLIAAEKSSAIASLTSQGNPEYCTTWQPETVFDAFPTVPLRMLPHSISSLKPLFPAQVPAEPTLGAAAPLVYTTASVITKVLPGQTSDVATPPPGFAIPSDSGTNPNNQPIKKPGQPDSDDIGHDGGHDSDHDDGHDDGHGVGNGQGSTSGDDNLVHNIVGAIGGIQNSGQDGNSGSGQGRTGNAAGQSPGPQLDGSWQGSPITVNGAGITPLAGGSIIVNGDVIQPGGLHTLTGGQAISLRPGGGVVIVNGATATIPQVKVTSNPSALMINNAEVTPLPNGAIMVDGNTILPGNFVTLGNGETMSLAFGGTAVVIDGQTQALNFPFLGTPVTIDGVIVTPIASSAIVVDGQTVYAGARSTLSNGQVVSVGNQGSVVIVNGVTGTVSPVTAIVPLVIGGETITPAPGGQIFLDNYTLSAGQAVTLSDGKVVSVGTSGTIVVDGITTSIPFLAAGSTTSANSTTTTSKQSTRSPGEAIASGIGATKAANANSLFSQRHMDLSIGTGIIVALVGVIAGL